MDDTKRDAADTPDRPKKPYTAPTLVRWGAIENFTRGAGNLGGPDATFQSQTGT